LSAEEEEEGITCGRETLIGGQEVRNGGEEDAEDAKLITSRTVFFRSFVTLGNCNNICATICVLSCCEAAVSICGNKSLSKTNYGLDALEKTRKGILSIQYFNSAPFLDGRGGDSRPSSGPQVSLNDFFFRFSFFIFACLLVEIQTRHFVFISSN